MKAILLCIVGTILLLVFAHPEKIAEYFSPSNRVTVEQATELTRALTGQYPHGVPVIVVGSVRDEDTLKLEAELQNRGINFTALEVTGSTYARQVMNKIGKQVIPTTIVGTCVIEGPKTDQIEQALLNEQKSMKWPVPKADPQAKSMPNRHEGRLAKPDQHSSGHRPGKSRAEH